jgi:pyruvate/2-oxoglutarate dehydrogenase complex dihydrolipoamide acyltransferase (E2) component
MSQHEVRLPELGSNIEKASISFWHYEEGDKVNEGDDLVEVVTEKATFNVPAPTSGILSKRLAGEGEEVKINQVIAIIEI